MDLSLAIKSPYVLGAVGTVGTGSVGVGVWQLSSLISWNESTLPLDSRPLTIKTEENSKFSFKSFGCFSRLFPGVTVGTTEDTDNTSGVDESKLKVTPSVSSESTTFGCSLFHVQHNLSVPSWMLRSEISFRNASIGWNLWVEGYGEIENGQGYSQDIWYRLTLLEKEDSKWKVKGGYAWEDKDISGSSLNVHIKVDWETQALLDETNSTSGSDSAPKKSSAASFSRNYERVWIEKSDGKGIFEEMKVWGKAADNYEILGRTKEFKNDKENMGYSSIERAYDIEQSKWVKQKFSSNNQWKSFDLTDTLTAWYAPFKNKKGGWVEMKGYCNDKTGNESSDAFNVVCLGK